MADSTSHYSSTYPWNIVPQVRSPKPSSPLPDLKCPPDSSLQSLVFDQNSLVVIKGWQWKSKFELNEFFIPVNGFLEAEILIPVLGDAYHYTYETYHETDAEYVPISYGFLQDVEGNIPFIAIFPHYHNTTINDQTLWRMHFRFQGETEWREMGKFFMWHASSESGIPPIELKNDILGEDLFIKVLIAN